MHAETLHGSAGSDLDFAPENGHVLQFGKPPRAHFAITSIARQFPAPCSEPADGRRCRCRGSWLVCIVDPWVKWTGCVQPVSFRWSTQELGLEDDFTWFQMTMLGFRVQFREDHKGERCLRLNLLVVDATKLGKPMKKPGIQSDDTSKTHILLVPFVDTFRWLDPDVLMLAA